MHFATPDDETICRRTYFATSFDSDSKFLKRFVSMGTLIKSKKKPRFCDMNLKEFLNCINFF